MSEIGDLPRPPEPQLGPRDEGYHPRSTLEPQARAGLRDRLTNLGRRAVETLVPSNKPITADALTMPVYAGLLLGGGEASERSPGLTEQQLDGLIGYDRPPQPGTPEHQAYLEVVAKRRRLTVDLVTDGTMRVVNEEQPSGDAIPTYALANKTQLENHTRPPQPINQAHPQE